MTDTEAIVKAIVVLLTGPRWWVLPVAFLIFVVWRTYVTYQENAPLRILEKTLKDLLDDTKGLLTDIVNRLQVIEALLKK